MTKKELKQAMESLCLTPSLTTFALDGTFELKAYKNTIGLYVTAEGAETQYLELNAYQIDRLIVSLEWAKSQRKKGAKNAK